LSAGITRANDFVARYGGEEFAVILPNTDETGARVVADKLLKNVSDLKIRHSDNAAAPYVTVSIGVTTGKASYMHNWEAFIKRADEALYASKHNGRNRCTYIAM
jgi:diguanylate cyclase (GGDEF)-like protein